MEELLKRGRAIKIKPENLLKSNLFRGNARIQRAAYQPFNSLKSGERDMAVQYLLMTLRDIQKHSLSLPTKLLPKPAGPFGPPGLWGPFQIEPDINSLHYSIATEKSITKFQSQAGNLEADGKAGMETIRRLDELQFYIEASGLLGSA